MMKTFGAHYESLFFILSIFLTLTVVLVTHGPAPIGPAAAHPAPPGYRIAITAKRLPVECLSGGARYGSSYCGRLLDRPVRAVFFTDGIADH